MSMFSEFMFHLAADGSMKLAGAPKKVRAWLNTLGLPSPTLGWLEWPWPQVDCQLGHLSVMSSSNIMKHMMTKELLPHRFLNLGSASNGDFFVLDFFAVQCQPGFISHEEYWGYKGSLREIFQPVATSLESLLYRFAERLYVPADYFAARDFNAFLKKELKNSEPCAPPNRRPAPHRKTRRVRKGGVR